jgi:hypothetical protein
VQLRVRETSVLRCVTCHDDLGADGVSCPCCSTKLHPECVTPKCPSLGCKHRFVDLIVKIARRINPAWRASSRWLWFIGIVFPLLAFVANELVRGSPLLPEERNPRRWLDLAYAPEPQECFYPLMLWAFAAYVAWLYGKRAPWIMVGLAGGVVLGIAASVLYARAFPMCLLGLITIVGVVTFAPYVTVFTYLHALRACVHERRPEAPGCSAGSVLGFTSLWTLFAGCGVHLAIIRMNELYAKLPEHVYHDCYFVTVAARGDPRLTGARPVRLREGRTMLVSRQLRRFKAFEIVLMAVVPRFHRALRAVYDRVGPPLAARMGPGAATVLHVLLKPIEVAIALVLRGLFRNPDALVNGTYRNS